MTTIRYGTSHFVSVSAAQRYYGALGYDRLAINDKLVNGEIFTTPPNVGAGERLVMIDGGLRYGVERLGGPVVSNQAPQLSCI